MTKSAQATGSSARRPSGGPQDLLRDVRLGTVTVFGVLLPGIWFMMSISLYVVGLSDSARLSELVDVGRQLSLAPSVLWIAWFVATYVAGSLLRMQSPDPLDRQSMRLGRAVAWVRGVPYPIAQGETFPYQSLPKYIRDRGGAGLAQVLPWDREAIGDEALCSNVFLNFAKMHVRARHRDLGDELLREEAFVRGLSGVTWGAVLCTVPSAVVAGFTSSVGSAFWAALFANIAVVALTLPRFHKQRLRETLKVAAAVYLVGERIDPPHPWARPAHESVPTRLGGGDDADSASASPSEDSHDAPHKYI
ncbi:MAG: hypothetical protein GY722_14530 [bacterium]|nr:hypothetical protein [bacterium]